MIHIVRFYTPRLPAEGVRIGTVRRPPRGVPKTEWSKRNIFDIWFPNLSPSQDLLRSYQDLGWEAWRRKFICEMKQPDASRTLDLFAALSHGANFSIGCYCGTEEGCHRSILRELLIERGARLGPTYRKEDDDPETE